MANSRLDPNISTSVRFDGRYDLLSPLGGGQFGEVWRAMDANTGRVVALKLIDPSQTTPADAWREATHLTSLESRYLVGVHGAALSSLGVPYVDMELAENGSVAARVAPYGVDQGTAIMWLQRAARGLHLCHQRGLVHRDIKPDNILLSATGDSLLGDFGVTAVLEPDGTADAHGDAHIRAPEVFNGRCSVVTDVYSLGVTLYHLVVGRYPHELAAYGAWPPFIAAVQRGVPDVRDSAPHINVGLARVIRKATEVSPASRYQTADELDRALAGVDAPGRIVSEVAPCVTGGRCWDAVAPQKSVGKPVHVRADPHGRRVNVDTRYVNGPRIKTQCGQVTKGQLPSYLKAVFRALT